MGRRSEVPSMDCPGCGAEVDTRYRSQHRHRHRCRREEIEWDETPDTAWSSEFIAWNGTCEVCGRRIYETYVSVGPLYDGATNKKI